MTHLQYIMMLGKMIMIQIDFSLICEITKQVDEDFSIEKFGVSDFIALSVSIVDAIVGTNFKGLTELGQKEDAFGKFLNQKIQKN